MDRKGLIDLSEDHLTEGELFELVSWVAASTIDLSAANPRVQIFRKQ